MFNKVLIANRGEIAVRIIRTLKRLGIGSVAVYSDADRHSLAVDLADEAIALGGDAPADSYLRSDKILVAARQCGADAIIPGYGFLSENASFAEQCAEAGITFVGPTPTQLRQFGLKHEARALASAANVPLTPGSGLLDSVAHALEEAKRVGFPLMLKSTAGGGGIGMTRCDSADELAEAFATVKRLGEQFFNDAGLFIERFVEEARHVEVQIVGDGLGTVAALGERDCSLQRRNQKVVEETPAPGLPAATRERMLAAAVSLGESVNYQSVGTVEFIYDGKRDDFYFLEVNTRLQVEHPITEAVTGIDLVEWMLLIAAGLPPKLNELPAPQGAAMEVRIYAEDPLRNFQPSPGTLTEVVFPDADWVRVDGWISSGSEVSPHYDPMLAKLIVHGTDRADALAKLQQALDATSLGGIASNLEYLRQITRWQRFVSGDVATQALNSFEFAPNAMEVVVAGTYTTVQDYPGRVGYWDIGVPPSGPMDDRSFRLANRLVGNGAEAAGLECTIIGPSLRFHSDTTIALTGALSPATLDGEPVPFHQAVKVTAGQLLVLGKVTTGCRTYLAVRGGVDVPRYLGSRATFALGQFGGHAGRPLRVGDVLALGSEIETDASSGVLVDALQPGFGEFPQAHADGALWEIGVLYGPHGAPDFFTADSIKQFFATAWEVHYNSNRLGIRLVGPKPSWTRTDGGEAGLHPSNIHDCEYAIGSINFTGDMPVILTHDGPSLGGFVCPVTIAKSELWKVGQIKPGDKIHFKPMVFDEALARELAWDEALVNLRAPVLPVAASASLEPDQTISACVISALPAEDERPSVAYRQAGDKYLLLEYGENVLDLALRLRIHALMESLRQQPIAGVAELSPSVRSLQIRYDSRVIHQRDLITALRERETQLPPSSQIKIPSRVVYLPLAFEDSATLDAVARYRQSVRDTAPWLPNNVDFIQRINGLESRDQVEQILFDARYMVLGLGDVYLGAPCAVPVDPRHRLLTSKYNPARTYTAEGTVGIGGVYMCIYGMDSPGGYQLVGRTLPIWNKFLKNPQFSEGASWLLRFFDQVKFYPVSEAELDLQREAFRHGKLTLRIEEEIFSLAEHEQFLADNAQSIADFKARQQLAFTKEVALWQNEEQQLAELAESSSDAEPLLEGQHAVEADISGNIWKLLVEPGQRVKAGEPLLIVEAMKMEFAVHAPFDGLVQSIKCKAGRPVQAGDALIYLQADTESELVCD